MNYYYVICFLITSLLNNKVFSQLLETLKTCSYNSLLHGGLDLLAGDSVLAKGGCMYHLASRSFSLVVTVNELGMW